jgi:NitT/TauT family transport system permease protein
VKAAKSMGVSSFRLFATVVLPASLPYIFTGMRISATTSILILIAAEMIGASRGLGYALFFYQSNMKIPEMFAYILVMALIGLSLNFTLEHIEKYSFRWRDEGGTTGDERN